MVGLLLCWQTEALCLIVHPSFKKSLKTDIKIVNAFKPSVMCSFFLLPEGAFQNHSRLRTPPLPLSHSHSPSHQHHAASINSLNRSNYTQRSNPSPAPTDSSVPPEGPASQDSVSVQDNWLLNSNIPLETRYVVICTTDNVLKRTVYF